MLPALLRTGLVYRPGHPGTQKTARRCASRRPKGQGLSTGPGTAKVGWMDPGPSRAKEPRSGLPCAPQAPVKDCWCALPRRTGYPTPSKAVPPRLALRAGARGTCSRSRCFFPCFGPIALRQGPRRGVAGSAPAAAPRPAKADGSHATSILRAAFHRRARRRARGVPGLKSLEMWPHFHPSRLSNLRLASLAGRSNSGLTGLCTST